MRKGIAQREDGPSCRENGWVGSNDCDAPDPRRKLISTGQKFGLMYRLCEKLGLVGRRVVTDLDIRSSAH